MFVNNVNFCKIFGGKNTKYVSTATCQYSAVQILSTRVIRYLSYKMRCEYTKNRLTLYQENM